MGASNGSLFRPFLLLLMTAAGSTMLAQAPWLLKAGANYTWYSDPLGLGHGPRTGRAASGAGYQVGASYELPFRSELGLSTEVQLTEFSAGYQFDETQIGYPPSSAVDGHDRGKRTMRCHRVDLPVSMVYRGWPGLRVEAGPYVSRLLRATEVWRGTRWNNGEEYDLDEQVDMTAMLAPWEFGAVLGVLVEGPRGVHVHLRYMGGFSNLDVAEGSSPSYTRQAQVALAYNFRGRTREDGPSTVQP